MADNSATKPKSFVAHIDEFFFLKNGYSVFRHLVPFAISALILLALSVPADNLLLKLVKLLQRLSWIWLPAGLLTLVSAAVYVVMINIQIKKAYLWSDGDLHRTIGTSLIYLILCALMVYAVLSSVSSSQVTGGDIWACFLVATLSLTGIGWKGPDWVEVIGIRSPNYSEGRIAAEKLEKILRRVRNEAVSNKRDVEDFLEVAEKLRSNIETNLEVEPEWAKDNLQRASDVLRALLEQAKKIFIIGRTSSVEDFAAACRYQKEYKYREFIETLKQISHYWRELSYEDSN
jgi:hypothetical protein